jgi:hypothetical protein
VLEFPGSADDPWKRYVQNVDPARGVGTVRYPRTVPKHAARAAKSKVRTLTNLYNEFPAWLAAAHKKFNAAADESEADDGSRVVRLLTFPVAEVRNWHD